MKSNLLTRIVVYCALFLASIAISDNSFAVDQPTSTIPEGEQFTLYNDSEADLTLSTSEVPSPRCPDDEPTGDPDYFWDFGPLNGTDNADGTATISADTAGDYSVTVYVSQEFSGEDGSYSEQTQTSD